MRRDHGDAAPPGERDYLGDFVGRARIDHRVGGAFQVAAAQGFVLAEPVKMPANTQLLVFERS